MRTIVPLCIGVLLMASAGALASLVPGILLSYLLCVGIIGIALIIWIGSDACWWLARLIVRGSRLSGYLLDDNKQANKWKKQLLLILAAIVTVLMIVAVNMAASYRQYPPLPMFYSIAILIAVAVVVYEIELPQYKAITGRGFCNSLGQQLLVIPMARQYVYVWQGKGKVAWKLLKQGEHHNLSYSRYYVIDLNEFQLEEDINRLFVGGGDFYVNGNFTLTVNEPNLSKRETLDRNTLTVIENLMSSGYIANLLKNMGDEFKEVIKDAHRYGQLIRREQIANPLGYWKNREKLLDAIQVFSSIGNQLAEKANCYINQQLQTLYIASRGFSMEIFSVKIVLSYMFDNQPFNACLITEVDAMIDAMLKEEVVHDRSLSLQQLDICKEAIKALARPELVRFLYEKMEQARERLLKWNTDNLKPGSLEALQAPEIRQDKQIAGAAGVPMLPVAGIDEAVEELCRFLNEPGLDKAHMARNLERFVTADYFKQREVIFEKLCQHLQTVDIRNADGSINKPVLAVLLNAVTVQK